jgi:hypothetical protein
MADRPTHEFKTSGGHVVMLNEYITGAENWGIRQVYIRAMKDGDAVALEAEKKALEYVVASIDGNSSNVADAILALPLSEYNEVVAAVTPIIDAKKKSETS